MCPRQTLLVVQVFPIGKMNMQVDCESSLLQPKFTFLVWPRPLVAILIIKAAKEEVRRSGIIRDTWRRLGMDGRVKKRQDFYPGDSQRSIMLTYCSLLRNL